jgi:hypothetical protein
MEALYKQRPELKSINPFGYQCLQELSAIISVFRFGNLDIVEQLTGKLPRKTKRLPLPFAPRICRNPYAFKKSFFRKRQKNAELKEYRRTMMNGQKMIIEYIRKGYRGKRITKDGIEFIQANRGPRIGVFVALNTTQFGWSLVHLKGENRELPKDISWIKGVKMAVERAKDPPNTEKIPDSIKRQFESFKKRAIMSFTERFIPVQNSRISITVSTDGIEKHFGLSVAKEGRIKIKNENFTGLLEAMKQAMAEELKI